MGGSLDAKKNADPKAKLQAWADGKLSLKDVRGYTDAERYAIAKVAYVFYYEGKLDEARALFQGLYAIDPADPYVAKSLAAVELAAGNTQGALMAYDAAQRLAPQDPGVYVCRAEVKLTLGQKAAAVSDLRKATDVAPRGDKQRKKAYALLARLGAL